ncbi:MAG: carbon storage regulator [Nitrosopumilus sp.]
MYVLARRKGESISLANGLITIKVLSVTGNIVRLGFDAPSEIDILRTETIEDNDDDGNK